MSADLITTLRDRHDLPTEHVVDCKFDVGSFIKREVEGCVVHVVAVVM